MGTEGTHWSYSQFHHHASPSLITILETCNRLFKEDNWGLSVDDQVALSGQKTYLYGMDLQVLLMSPMTCLLHSLTVNLGIKSTALASVQQHKENKHGAVSITQPRAEPSWEGNRLMGKANPIQGWRWCFSWLPAPSGEAWPVLVLAPVRTMEVKDKGWIRTKITSESGPYHRDWMLQLGCISPSHRSSTPASPSLFSPMCSTFRCLLVLRAELTALQQAVVSPHSLTLQGKANVTWDLGGTPRDNQAPFTSLHLLYRSPDSENRGTRAFLQSLYSSQCLCA